MIAAAIQPQNADSGERLKTMTVRDNRPSAMIDQRVRGAGLRPTRQRVALAELLFAKGDRHLTAEMLY